MTKSLKLRGAAQMLSRAIAHVGRNQKTNEWTDGSYCDAAVEKADHILRLALWRVDVALAKLNK